MERGRVVHREWVRRVFHDDLAKRHRSDRDRLTAQIVAVLDVYTWKLLRRDLKLNRAETERTITEPPATREGTCATASPLRWPPPSSPR